MINNQIPKYQHNSSEINVCELIFKNLETSSANCRLGERIGQACIQRRHREIYIHTKNIMEIWGLETGIAYKYVYVGDMWTGDTYRHTYI